MVFNIFNIFLTILPTHTKNRNNSQKLTLMSNPFLATYFQEAIEGALAQQTLVYGINILLFIVLSIAIVIIVMTPVVLFLSGLHHYSTWKANGAWITNELCCQEQKVSSHHVSEVCKTYQKSFSSLLGAILGLVAWNVFSLIYISTAFPDFQTGLIDYFLFPFEVLESYNLSNMMASFNDYNAKWIFMFSILALTIICYQIGKVIAPYVMRKKTLQVAHGFSMS